MNFIISIENLELDKINYGESESTDCSGIESKSNKNRFWSTPN